MKQIYSHEDFTLTEDGRQLSIKADKAIRKFIQANREYSPRELALILISSVQFQTAIEVSTSAVDRRLNAKE